MAVSLTQLPKRRHATRWTVVGAVLAGLLALAPGVALAAPETTITAKPQAGANDGHAEFMFTTDVPQGTTFECSRDGAAYAACTSPKTYTGLSDGTHTFTVRARDAAAVYDPTPASASWSVEPLTGIGFGTSYTRRGNYIWGQDFGTDSTQQFVADVDGDGDDDAIAFYKDPDGSGVAGRWYVAKATDPRWGLSPPGAAWRTGHGATSASRFMADANGDGKADAITFNGTTGDFYVALSNGSSFGTPTSWTTGHGVGSSNQKMADVNGDHKADAVVYNNASGSWYVRLSNGTSFPPGGLWKSGFSINADRRLLADVTGDGAADAISYDAATGTWLVAPSCATPTSPCSPTGTNSFGAVRTWLTGFGEGDAQVLMGDVASPNSLAGDGKADAVAYYYDAANDRYVWDRAISDGTRLVPPNPDHVWKVNHRGFGTQTQPLLGNMDKQLTDDAGTYGATDDPVIFSNDDGGGLKGRWKWLPSEGFEGNAESPVETATGDVIGERYRPAGPFMWNNWQSPGDDGTAQTALQVEGWQPVEGRYDAFDAAMADNHLRTLRDAKIDFVSTDQTNGLFVSGRQIFTRSRLLCQRIRALRATDPRIPRFTTAIGDFGDATPHSIYVQAKAIWDTFVAGTSGRPPACGPVDASGLSEGYQRIGGKPVITLYLERNRAGDWKTPFVEPSAGNAAEVAWVTDHFTIRWHKGNMDPEDFYYPDADWENDWQHYFSGVYWDGSQYSQQTMHVQPGWGRPEAPQNLPRQISQDGVTKEFYDVCAWKRVMAQNPRPDVVTVSGFHDYHERGAVGPTYPPANEGWKSGTYYWDQTKYYNARRKAGQIGDPRPNEAGCDHPGEHGP